MLQFTDHAAKKCKRIKKAKETTHSDSRLPLGEYVWYIHKSELITSFYDQFHCSLLWCQSGKKIPQCKPTNSPDYANRRLKVLCEFFLNDSKTLFRTWTLCTTQLLSSVTPRGIVGVRSLFSNAFFWHDHLTWASWRLTGVNVLIWAHCRRQGRQIQVGANQQEVLKAAANRLELLKAVTSQRSFLSWGPNGWSFHRWGEGGNRLGFPWGFFRVCFFSTCSVTSFTTGCDFWGMISMLAALAIWITKTLQ